MLLCGDHFLLFTACHLLLQMRIVVVLSASRWQPDHIYCWKCIGESWRWTGQNWYLHTNRSCTKEGKSLQLILFCAIVTDRISSMYVLFRWSLILFRHVYVSEIFRFFNSGYAHDRNISIFICRASRVTGNTLIEPNYASVRQSRDSLHRDRHNMTKKSRGCAVLWNCWS